MAIKVYKPTTNGRRNMSTTDYSKLSKVAPERSLLEPLKKTSGRNSYGRITVRHHGGGEGKSPIGRPGPVTPWGKPALGYKTRAKHKRSDKLIVKRCNDK